MPVFYHFHELEKYWEVNKSKTHIQKSLEFKDNLKNAMSQFEFTVEN